jgi:hypothetical protein
VLIIPAGVIFRMRLLAASATYILPPASVATLTGEFNAAVMPPPGTVYTCRGRGEGLLNARAMLLALPGVSVVRLSIFLQAPWNNRKGIAKRTSIKAPGVILFIFMAKCFDVCESWRKNSEY